MTDETTKPGPIGTEETRVTNETAADAALGADAVEAGQRSDTGPAPVDSSAGIADGDEVDDAVADEDAGSGRVVDDAATDPAADAAPEAGVDLPDPSPAGTVAQRLEAILMIADEPLSLVSLATAVAAPVPAVRQSIESLAEDYDGDAAGPRRGFELREVGGGWRFYVREELDGVVADFIGDQAPARLSQAALETLAVIAYKEPVTRSQVASIRAVNVDSVVRTLLARGLVTELHTDPETGAMNYGTTDLLLLQLGINSLDELPPISPLLEDGADGFDETPI